MHPPTRHRRPEFLPSSLAALIACLGCLAPLPSSSSAATPAAATQSGTIFGRVQQAESGEYLTNARVTVKGSGLVVFTDASGTFRLSGVPAGPVVLQVFYTGLALTRGRSVGDARPRRRPATRDRREHRSLSPLVEIAFPRPFRSKTAHHAFAFSSC